MALQEKLDHMRREFESTAPPEALEVLHRAAADLLASDIMDGVLRVGDRAPDFSLLSHNTDRIYSSSLLAKGPLVISFYRGVW